ncbi:MAG TPA: glycosyltransferase [Gemmatimonadaceae bacterium]|nr:glycosyltransferase [Gemmatimonadaceae bacterium]
MRIVMFYHSLVSDWNHGNAHFLRGVVAELLARGHDVRVYEPADGWSRTNLVREQGTAVLAAFASAFPGLESTGYRLDTLDLDEALDGADLVLVHEWNEHELVRRIGAHRAATRAYPLLFHDTHHRSVTDRDGVAGYDLRHFDGVLAFGEVVRSVYLEMGWTERAWTWHEAADVRVFRPRPETTREGDVVWIGNWGDDERSAELHRFLIEPVRSLGARARAFGVRYPDSALRALDEAGIDYDGWLPNHLVPVELARHALTVHVPRRPYVRALPGIPTIRVFEALACGIPLVCAPWHDTEGLFAPDRDFLVAPDGRTMRSHMRMLLHDRDAAAGLAAHGLQTVRSRHTCAHRVDELLAIAAGCEPGFTGRTIAA